MKRPIILHRSALFWYPKEISYFPSSKVMRWSFYALLGRLLRQTFGVEVSAGPVHAELQHRAHAFRLDSNDGIDSGVPEKAACKSPRDVALAVQEEGTFGKGFRKLLFLSEREERISSFFSP